jgi:hypothetical protein
MTYAYITIFPICQVKMDGNKIGHPGGGRDPFFGWSFGRPMDPGVRRDGGSG